ncbi:MAG: Argininosuccinate lyase 1 [Firmicutes bacterium ADurb.Bin193]|nr:MAG: Argininosuccinate lyase 1 [Firmicutes bacterium ADurb.Bin193]
MKLWGGRFSKSTDKSVDSFNSSIGFDARMYRQDINGSIAHCEMLGKQGIIPKSDADLIIKTLGEILSDIEDGLIEFSIEAEDIHMNIEKLLIERIGDIGKRLHTGRSRNDQVALDLRLYLRDECEKIRSHIKDFNNVLIELAEANIGVVMPGYTHLQKAQPILFSHHLMAYFEMLCRDSERLLQCIERMNVSPLGSGALAGTTYPLDREFAAAALGMKGITQNSLDGVSDRDFAIEVCFVMSMIMMHLSRLAEEIILWSSGEFGFVELDDAFSTGSSIMPQKKNPDIAELARGKTGRVYGDLIALLTVMKGLPLAYNKDMQEDKEQVFDAVDTVSATLPVFAKMLSTMKVNKSNMRKAAAEGFTNATDAADYLVKKGLPFRDAHKVIGEMVAFCTAENRTIESLSLDEFKGFCPLFGDDIYNAVSLENCVNLRDIPGGTSLNQVKSAIKNAKRRNSLLYPTIR